ncbi:PREDICTED: uncharacterized protein LOC106805140 [Priapulus caudatus]|uniref:Uncharacterized protein LOC106805140 n=1 Tax=Priapulus caudatus TaxID=37621 RepID=A0ABM1DQ96_PRICU|nr:PREDICTED: uncharacterized protein LOC106805140 [Priapulus caudatus]
MVVYAASLGDALLVSHVKLKEGKQKYGRLEIEYDNGEESKWSAVCSKSFKQEYVDLVCKNLGYPVGGTFWNYPIRRNKKVASINCDGAEAITDCTVSDRLLPGDDECERCHGIGVICAPTMRLAGFDPMIGPTDFKSVLQVYHDGQWKAVCYPEVLDSKEKHGMLGEILCRSVGQKKFVMWNKAFRHADMFLNNYTEPRTQMELTCYGEEMDVKECNPVYTSKTADDDCTVIQLTCADDTYTDVITEEAADDDEFCNQTSMSEIEETSFVTQEGGSLHHICYDLLSGRVISQYSKSLDYEYDGDISSDDFPLEYPAYRDCRWVVDFSAAGLGVTSTRLMKIVKITTSFPTEFSGSRLEIRDYTCLYSNNSCPGVLRAAWITSGSASDINAGLTDSAVMSVRFVSYPVAGLAHPEPWDGIRGFSLRWKFAHTPQYMSDYIFHSPMMPVYVAALAILVVFPFGCFIYCVACRGGCGKPKKKNQTRDDEEIVKPQQLDDAVGSDSELDKL